MSGERTPGTHWIGDWVVPELVWTLQKRENLCPCHETEPQFPGCPPHSILTILTQLSRVSQSQCAYKNYVSNELYLVYDELTNSEQ
jgi:hypothetical protein